MPASPATFGPYFTGAQWVHGDPIRIYRRLSSALGGEPNKWLDRFYAQPEQDDEARDKVIQAAGWAFEMVPFDRAQGTGATEEVVESVLRDYQEWLEGNGLPATTSRTWSRPTAPESSPSTPEVKPGCGCG